MGTFSSNGVEIAFNAAGWGEPVVLIHGFAANRNQAWKATGVIDMLDDTTTDWMALDLRGHGESQKSEDPDFYNIDEMAEDVIRLMDHLEFKKGDVVGHSMGAMVTLRLLARHPDRFKRAVLVGVGERMFEKRDNPGAMADAMRAENPNDIKDERARSFRAFAESTGSDLKSLAACASRRREPLSDETLKSIKHPILVITGGDDEMSGKPERLADALGNAESAVVEGASHHSVLQDRSFHQALYDFLDLRGNIQSTGIQ